MDGVADLFSRHSQRLALVVAIALVALMGLLIANTTTFLIEDSRSAAVSAPRSGPDATLARSAPTIDIGAMSLFGQIEAGPVKTLVDAPETKLNLELQGVFIANDAAASTAIVAEGAKDGKLYDIGKSLPGNAVLEGVFHDHILLRRGARIEKLKFSDAAFRTATSASATRAGNVPRARTSPGMEGVDDSTGQRRSIDDRLDTRRRGLARSRSGRPSLRNVIDEQRQRIRSDPKGMLGELGVTPVGEGSAQGYRVGSEITHPALRNTGLRRGDIVLSVNGTPIGNINQDSAIVDQVLVSRKARVQIQRGKSKFFITVPVN